MLAGEVIDEKTTIFLMTTYLPEKSKVEGEDLRSGASLPRTPERWKKLGNHGSPEYLLVVAGGRDTEPRSFISWSRCAPKSAEMTFSACNKRG